MKIKRLFDLLFALSGILTFGILILICIILATIDTKSFGIFTQKRIGQYGKSFRIFKIKTLHDKTKTSTRLGSFFRSTKLDELPQLFNILNGSMSLVGPRPDVPGYADELTGNNKLMLKVRPGITGLASLQYRNEEQLLNAQTFPLQYNDAVIWPDKVRINNWYVRNHTIILDLKILFYTIFPRFFELDKFIRQDSVK